MKQSIKLRNNNKLISEERYIKYLGILIDSTLSWKVQISSLCKKMSRTIGIMYKLKSFVPSQIMKNIYYSLVYSHITYTIEVWGSAFKTEIHKVLVLQKRAIRLITRNENTTFIPGPLAPSNPIFRKIGTLKVFDIYKYQISKFIFKCLYRLGPINFQNWFVCNHDNHRYNTRSNVNIDNGTNQINIFVPYTRRTMV